MSDSEATPEESNRDQTTPEEANRDQTTKAPVETLNLRVVSQVNPEDYLISTKDGNEVFFKIKKTTPLAKLTGAYLQRQGISEESMRFLFDGNRIRNEQTPGELGMEENDVIDAVLMQTGG